MESMSLLQWVGLGLAFLAISVATHAILKLLFGTPDRKSLLVAKYEREEGNAWERFSRAASKILGDMLVSRRWLESRRVRVARNLRRAGRESDSADEYAGFAILIGLLSCVGAVVVVFALFGTLSIVAGLLGLGVGYFVTMNTLQNAADRRVLRITRRLPYAVDMIVLAVEAGASFDESVTILVTDSPNEPLHEEFAQVLRDGRLGVPRAESLVQMSERVGTEDLNSLVLAINLGDELGTPIGQTLRVQADAIRMRRTQRAEKLAGEAGPKMALPNTLIMLANMLLILAPFIHKFGEGGGIF